MTQTKEAAQSPQHFDAARAFTDSKRDKSSGYIRFCFSRQRENVTSHLVTLHISERANYSQSASQAEPLTGRLRREYKARYVKSRP